MSAIFTFHWKNLLKDMTNDFFYLKRSFPSRDFQYFAINLLLQLFRFKIKTEKWYNYDAIMS